MKNILFVNSSSPQCGIYQFGSSIGKVITTLESKNIYRYIEPKDVNEFESIKEEFQADIVIINYVDGALNWLKEYSPTDSAIYVNILHEQDMNHLKSFFKNFFFKYTLHANPQPSFIPYVFSLPRLLPNPNTIPYIEKNPIRVGASGFGILDRGWLQVIDRVQEEFEEADIEFQMPFNSVVDPDGSYYALKTAELCRKKELKPGVTLKINHNFLPTEDVVRWLGQNTINLCLYQEKEKRGISSAVDFALAARRPIGISSSPMFDHLAKIKDLICVETNSIRSIIERGTEIFTPYYKKWSQEEFFFKFELILDKCR